MGHLDVGRFSYLDVFTTKCSKVNILEGLIQFWTYYWTGQMISCARSQQVTQHCSIYSEKRGVAMTTVFYLLLNKQLFSSA